MANSELRVFYGTSHPELGEKIVKHLGLKKGEIKISRFSCGEIYARINENVRGASCVIIQTCTDQVNSDLMELFIIIDAMKRASARSVTAVIPHFGYARQDRKAASREPISARLVANLIEKAGADRVVAMDLHSDQIQGFFNIPVDHLFAAPVLVDYFQKMDLPDLLVVSPDAGGTERARAYAKRLKTTMAIIDKRRVAANVAEVMNVVGDVEGRTALIVDDLIDTAGTLVKSADALLEKGALAVYACCSHPVLSGPAVQRIEKSAITQVVVTDSIPLSREAATSKRIRSLSVADLLGKAIKSIHEETSVSSLFI